MSFARLCSPSCNAVLRFSDSTLAKDPRRKTWLALSSLSAGCFLVLFAAPVPAQEQTAKAGTAVEWAQKGNRLMQQDDLDGAIEAFTKAIELDPRMAAAYCNRGLARSYKGDFDGGIADSTKAIELDPKDPFPFINRANARIRKGVDPDASIADTKKALGLRPGIPAALLNLGMAPDQKGDYDGAIAEFNKALDLLPSWGQGYAQRAQTRTKMKQWDKAEDDFTRRNHAQAPYLTILGHCARRQQQPDEARRAVAALIKGGKVGWPASVLRYLHGDISAEELQQEAVDNDERTEARAYVGVVQWLAGAADKAREHLQWVSDNGNPDFVEFDLALVLLRRLEGEGTRKP